MLKKLLRIWDIALKRQIKKPLQGGIRTILQELDSRVNLIRSLKDEEIEPLKLIHTDYTIIYSQYGKLYLVPYLDNKSKIVTGFSISRSPDSQTALQAFKQTKIFLKEQNIDFNEVIIHQDQGSSFTSYEYVGALTLTEAKVSYSRKGKFQDNSIMEAFFSQFKRDWKEVFASAKDLEELKELIEEAIKYYNQERIHSRCNGVSPLQYLSTIQIST